MGTISQRNMLSLRLTRNCVASRPRKLGVANPPRASAGGAAAPAGASAARAGPATANFAKAMELVMAGKILRCRNTVHSTNQGGLSWRI